MAEAGKICLSWLVVVLEGLNAHVDLFQLYLNDNKLTGRFPQGWSPIYYLTNIDIRNNQFTQDIPSSVCSMNVFDEAEMVELRADCDICDCRRLCDNCDHR